MTILSIALNSLDNTFKEVLEAESETICCTYDKVVEILGIQVDLRLRSHLFLEDKRTGTVNIGTQ